MSNTHKLTVDSNGRICNGPSLLTQHAVAEQFNSMADQRAELLETLADLSHAVNELGRCLAEDPAEDEWDRINDVQRAARAAIAKAIGGAK